MKQKSDYSGVNHSLFAKLFYSTALIVCVGFVILITAITVISTKMWRDQKLASLEQNARSLVATFKEIDAVGYGNLELARVSATVANSSDSHVFFVDVNGRTYICSDDENHVNCVHYQHIVSKNIMDNVLSGEIYRETGKFDGMYTVNHYIVGIKLNDFYGDVRGAVFIASKAEGIGAYVSDVLNTSLLAAVCILLSLFVFIYFFAKSIVKPLQQMSVAARSIVNGDFSCRVKATGLGEIRELADSFNTMAESIESLETMRSSFVTNVSHELKTPMTTIGGFVDAILSGTIPPQQQNHYLSVVSDEVKRMSSLVNSMLVLSKLDSGQTQLQCSEVDIVDTICRVVIAFERRIEEKNLEIIGMENMGRVLVECDGKLIHQVIYNLFDNAVKFTPEGGYISIFISEYNSRIEIYIKNSGEGIPEEERKHIFERFYKTDKSRSIDKSGVGLGLYIVKSIMKYHYGDVQVKSVEGLYTQFSLILPKKHTAEESI